MVKDRVIQLNDFEKLGSRESYSIHKTKVQFCDPVTGEVLYEKPNKVILPGSIFTACKHFNVDPPVTLPTYNSVIGLDQSVSEDFGSPGVRREETVVLFAVGTDGCGTVNSDVKVVNYSKWLKPADMVPFKYPPSTSDLSNAERNTYFGRKTLAGRFAYYFKKFETDPIMNVQYVDGTPVDQNVFDSTKTDDIETYIELKMKITKDDCREYFQVTSSINDAEINTLSLLTAWPKTITDKVYYQDIRPITKINIPNEPLIDLSKGMDIIYNIYY